MSASWSLGDGPPLPLLCFVEIQWIHVHRVGIYGYGYIHGYPRKNLWIWIWIWIGNFISKASLLITDIGRRTCSSSVPLVIVLFRQL